MILNQDDFKTLLKNKGLKITNQRLLILEALSKSKDKHLTAEEIYEIVKTDCPELGLATVYRTIQLLLELHLIDRISLDDGFIRYEIGTATESESKHHHHHLICQECGKVMSFQDDLLEELEDKIRHTVGFEVVDHEVKLYGYCKECGGKTD